MGDHDGLRRTGRSGRQLHQGDVVLAGLRRVDRLRGQQFLNSKHRHAALFEDRCGHQERIGDDDRFGVDHVDDVGGVLGPVFEVCAGGRLVQHRQAGAAHPQGLSGRCDLHRCTRQHADGITPAHPGGGQSPGDAPGALVHLTPGVPDRFQGFPSHHALVTGHGTAEHLVRESAHDALLGFRFTVANGARRTMLRPRQPVAWAARPDNSEAFRSRNGDGPSASASRRPPRVAVGDPQTHTIRPLVITEIILNFP